MATEAIEFSPQAAPDHYLLTGVLTFATASAALKAAEPLLRSASLRLDLSGVSRADSSGVGVLIEWLRRAEAAGCRLQFAHIPESLRAMMRVGGVEGLLPLDSAAGPPYKYHPKQETI